jgi:hypothetical protein
MVSAKFLSDSAWFFCLFWLPKYLYDARGFDIKQVSYFAWIPYAASGLGSFAGGWFSSRLLRRGHSLNFSRKLPLGLSAALMPAVILVPHVSVSFALLLFSIAFFRPAVVVWTDHDAADRCFPAELGWLGRGIDRLWRRHGGRDLQSGRRPAAYLWSGLWHSVCSGRKSSRGGICHPSFHLGRSASTGNKHIPRTGETGFIMKIREVRTRVAQWSGKTTPLSPHFCTNPMDLLSLPQSPP